MGYTSQTVVATPDKKQLFKGKKVIEASEAKFFNYSLGRLFNTFPLIEICDNGKVTLKDEWGFGESFVTFGEV